MRLCFGKTSHPIDHSFCAWLNPMNHAIGTSYLSHILSLVCVGSYYIQVYSW